MSAFELTLTALTALSVLAIPALAILIRGAVKWTRTEDRLGELVDDVRALVEDQDKTHAELLALMRSDREGFDRRLRFVEEFWMSRGRENAKP